MFISFLWGVFVRGVFGKGGFCPGGFCPGVYVRGVFVRGVFVLIPLYIVVSFNPIHTGTVSRDNKQIKLYAIYSRARAPVSHCSFQCSHVLKFKAGKRFINRPMPSPSATTRDHCRSPAGQWNLPPDFLLLVSLAAREAASVRIWYYLTLGGHDGPQDIFYNCSETLWSKKLKLCCYHININLWSIKKLF